MSRILRGKILALFVVGLALLAACGTPSPATSPIATPTAGESASQTVTLDNNGQTITLSVGERFLLKLGEEYDWTVTVADPSIVSRVVNITVVRGAQGVYEAHKPGSTTLTASGDPVCRQAQPPCGMPSILFEITMVVQG
jgi:hypothetical protein